MSKRVQLFSAAFAFILVAASVYLVVASWSDPAAVLGSLMKFLPAIFGSSVTVVLAMVVLLFAALYAFLIQRLRQSESLIAAQEAELRANEQAARNLQPAIDQEPPANPQLENALNESLAEQDRLKQQLLQYADHERQLEELREEIGKHKRYAETLTRSKSQLEETLMEVREKAANTYQVEEKAKAMHETAARTLRAKDELTDNIITDLRTPLISIIGFSDSMLQKAHGEFGNDLYEEYVENMNEQATHLLALVDEALIKRDEEEKDKEEEEAKKEEEQPTSVVVELLDSAIGYGAGGNETIINSTLINPKYAIALAHYAGFSVRTGNDQKLADSLFQRAIAADPGNAVILSNYSLFRSTLREDHDRMDELYQQFLDADPENETLMLGYGVFLSDIRKKHDRAEKIFRHVIATAPDSAQCLRIYAGFLTRIREDFDHAETLYRKATDAEPDNVDLLSDHAWFLWKIRNNTEQVDELYQRAVAVNPIARKPRLAYAIFLLFKGESEKGLPMLQQIVPELSGEELLQAWFYQYAYGRHDTGRAEALKELRNILESKVRSPSFDQTDDVRYVVDAGHPEPELLDNLGRVISGREHIDVLDQYPAWRVFDFVKPEPPEPPVDVLKAIEAIKLKAKKKRRRERRRRKERKKICRQGPGGIWRQTAHQNHQPNRQWSWPTESK